MTAARLAAMQAGLERHQQQVREQNARDWVEYRKFLAEDAHAWATTGKGLSWAHVTIPRGSEHS